MSSSLQSIVDELVVKRVNKDEPVPESVSKGEDGDSGKFMNWCYLSRDRGLIKFNPSKSDGKKAARRTSKQEQKKSSTTVLFRSERAAVQNEAFEGIGDDDL